MTTAPPTLLAARRLLLDHLDLHPGKVVPADLDPAEVGIVGDAAHVGEGDSYHLGSPEQDPRGSYSVRETPRDRALTGYACALDVGDFTVSVGGRRHDLRSFSVWLVAQCKAGAGDTGDIREVIYSPDGRTVRRWDRWARRTSGDSSHLWHTHISFHRDAIKAGRDQTPVFRRYLTSIGLIKPPAPKPAPAPTPVEEPDMEQSDKLTARTDNANRTVGQVLGDWANLRNWLVSPVGTQDAYLKLSPTSPLALLLNAAGRDGTDEQAIIAGVLAGLDPATIAQRIAEHLPADQAKQVADELSARLAA
ncbi:hypothetical protein ACIA5A_06045 [Micromonospora sp. NPDC051300]|uniref:hypothetical protein n=1 Tax=Micromonospora sp. NPDC051300 TaxID=3364286 RepID=UPI0037AA758E